MKQVEFIVDVASPNAYLVNQVLPAICASHGASLKYTPCLLGGLFKSTNNQAPMMAFAEIKEKLAYENLEMQRFIELHQLTKFKMNPHFPVNTLLTMRGAIVADQIGRLKDYIDAMSIAMWEDGMKLDDLEVLGTVWAKAGFDADEFAQKVQDPAVKQVLVDNTADAVARGCFGVPSFFVGDQLFFGKERFAQIEALL
ncbi:2-hydroxychromene-2-carboxylate isomerase [Alphaproteobacteria bacterium]|jgi:2-hydroxychromene-2-carboxylate isomerase|nr:2-hydroxychromene-2-carboxylate isomerase [Alphaproteobacteria bacterium]